VVVGVEMGCATEGVKVSEQGVGTIEVAVKDQMTEMSVPEGKSVEVMTERV
jgi:hypothetical protein